MVKKKEKPEVKPAVLVYTATPQDLQKYLQKQNSQIIFKPSNNLNYGKDSNHNQFSIK